MAERRIAVIAGGGSGIGQGCALQLAAEGWHLVLVGRNADKLAATEALIAEKGGSAECFPADVREWDRMGELGALVAETGLDLLINSAGGQFAKLAKDLSRGGWKAVVETNLDGAFFLSRQLYPALAKRKGAVVHVVANLWQRGAATMAHSAAARAGVVNLMQTLAIEWAADGVRVNAVSPGYIDTAGLLADYKRDMEGKIPLGRIGLVEECVEAILFMARASYITGEVLTVDGGLQLV